MGISSNEGKAISILISTRGKWVIKIRARPSKIGRALFECNSNKIEFSRIIQSLQVQLEYSSSFKCIHHPKPDILEADPLVDCSR